MTTQDGDVFADDGESGGHDSDFEGLLDTVNHGRHAGRNRAAWSRIEDILDQRRLSRELADFDDEL